jgi:hypothetical protein
MRHAVGDTGRGPALGRHQPDRQAERRRRPARASGLRLPGGRRGLHPLVNGPGPARLGAIVCRWWPFFVAVGLIVGRQGRDTTGTAHTGASARAFVVGVIRVC